MDRVKIGVFGVGRGGTMMRYCKRSEHASLVAICDRREDALARKRKELGDPDIAFYTSFDEFLNHDMDAVVLANYATEHAPYAIRCLEQGKHVISEVLPVQTLQEAVQLIEAVERTGKVYAYAENYCFMPAPKEMRRLYKQGALGEFEYGEGEYLHNCEPIWPEITRGEPDHWRNRMYASFYCTHSIGPLLHITGLRPVKVCGYELPFNDRMARCGAKGGHSAVEMITLENGALIKSLHGCGIARDSVWFTLYGSKGRLESARWDAECGDFSRLYYNCDSFEGENKNQVISYRPTDALSEKAQEFGHGSSDFYTMYNFIEKILGNQDTDVIDVYQAVDMFLPGLFAYRSVLQGGVPVDIPDLRDPLARELLRNDTACTDPQVAGDQLLPSYSKGNPEIPSELYAKIHARWLEIQAAEDV